MIPNYQIIQKLGEGSQGNIYLVSDEFGQKYALKEQWTITDNEITFVEKLIQSKPSNLIQYYQFFTHQGKYYFVMEYANGGDLYHYLLNKQPDQAEIRNIVKQICLGVQELHNLQLIHRDLKPENILLFQDQNNMIKFKICDFGLIKSQKDIGRQTINIGTPYYQAPELINESGSTYDNKVDIWSLACLIYEIYNRYPLFNGKSVEEIQQNVRDFDSQHVNRKISILNVPTEIKNMLIKMLNKNPNFRPNIHEVASVFTIKIIVLQKQQLSNSISNNSQQDISNQQQQIQVASQNQYQYQYQQQQQQQQQQCIQNPSNPYNPQKVKQQQINLQPSQFTQQLPKSNYSVQEIQPINSLNTSLSQQTPISQIQQSNQGGNNQIKIVHQIKRLQYQELNSISNLINQGVHQNQSQQNNMKTDEHTTNQAFHQSQQQSQFSEQNSFYTPHQSQQQSQFSEQNVFYSAQVDQQNNQQGSLQNQQQGNSSEIQQNINLSNNQVSNQIAEVKQLHIRGQQQQFNHQTKDLHIEEEDNKMQQLINNQQQQQQTYQGQSQEDGSQNNNYNVQSSNQYQQSDMVSAIQYLDPSKSQQQNQNDKINFTNDENKQYTKNEIQLEQEKNYQNVNQKIDEEKNEPKAQDLYFKEQKPNSNPKTITENETLGIKQHENSDAQSGMSQTNQQHQEMSDLQKQHERRNSNSTNENHQNQYNQEVRNNNVTQPYNNIKSVENQQRSNQTEQRGNSNVNNQSITYSGKQTTNTYVLNKVLTSDSIQYLIDQKLLDQNFTKQQFLENKDRIINFLLNLVCEQ